MTAGPHIPLSIAVAQPRVHLGDVAANVRSHAELISAAGARVVVFPELSLTGYDLDAPAVDPSSPVLLALVEACRVHSSIALVGAPIVDSGVHHIATLVVDGHETAVAYRKMFLGGDEDERFSAGNGPGIMQVDGWRVGLGICKDTRIDEHIDATISLGIDLYVAGVVHGPEEVRDHQLRAQRIGSRAGVPVAFASAAGTAGPLYPNAPGLSSIWDRSGRVVAAASSEPDTFAQAFL